jgi:hypothetical protein
MTCDLAQLTARAFIVGHTICPTSSAAACCLCHWRGRHCPTARLMWMTRITVKYCFKVISLCPTSVVGMYDCRRCSSALWIMFLRNWTDKLGNFKHIRNWLAVSNSNFIEQWVRCHWCAWWMSPNITLVSSDSVLIVPEQGQMLGCCHVGSSGFK